MRVITRTVFRYIDGRFTLVAENTRICLTPVSYCKGATSQQNDLQQQQAQFYKTLQGAYQTAFANQQAIMNAVKSVYDPIMAAGPNQFGFSKAQETALRTQASEGTAANYRQAGQATAERLAAAGGGNSFLPSGVNAEIQGKISGAAAGQESTQQLNITNEGYNVGRENFLQASNAELGLANLANPLGYAGAATSAGGLASNTASQIQQANAAASPWGTIGGLVGGVAGAAAGPFGAALGSKLGGMLGNAGSGSNFNPTGAYSPGFSQAPSDSYT